MNNIPIASFCAFGIKGNPLTTVEVKPVDEYGYTKYYFIADNGNLSTCYRSLEQARMDIVDVYGMIKGFILSSNY